MPVVRLTDLIRRVSEQFENNLRIFFNRIGPMAGFFIKRIKKLQQKVRDFNLKQVLHDCVNKQKKFKNECCSVVFHVVFLILMYVNGNFSSFTSNMSTRSSARA
jgi:hypothetical protein